MPTAQTAARLDAVQAVHRLLNTGYTDVVDADLSGYFDSIPHAELMQCVARRVSDKAVLHLLKLWLVAPVEEKDARGHVRSARPATRTKVEAARKAHRSHRCWPICTCGGSCWAGKRWDTSSGSKLASSTTPTTS